MNKFVISDFNTLKDFCPWHYKLHSSDFCSAYEKGKGVCKLTNCAPVFWARVDLEVPNDH